MIQESTEQPRSLQRFRWGLVPSWSKDSSIGNRMINARGETVDSKQSFRASFASRRCLIPADGFYEWKKVSDGKQPYLIEPSQGGMLAMAGLWEENQKLDPSGTPMRSFTIITTSASRVISALHDRMPVLLQPGDFQRWLDPDYRDVVELKKLMVPAQDDALCMTPVSKRVNNPRNDDEPCAQSLAGGVGSTESIDDLTS